MKNESRIAFNVRLNLNKPVHQQAWEYLQSRRTSYSETCVAAINAMADNEALAAVKRVIDGIVRDAVADVFRQISWLRFSVWIEWRSARKPRGTGHWKCGSVTL